MAHDKVYGACENLCKVEVIAKENFAIVTGALTNETGWIEVNYPEGFSKDNCYVISIMTNKPSNNNIWSYGFDFSSGGYTLGGIQIQASLNDNVIRVRGINVNGSPTMEDNKLYCSKPNYQNFKIILMKVQ